MTANGRPEMAASEAVFGRPFANRSATRLRICTHAPSHWGLGGGLIRALIYSTFPLSLLPPPAFQNFKSLRAPKMISPRIVSFKMAAIPSPVFLFSHSIEFSQGLAAIF